MSLIPQDWSDDERERGRRALRRRHPEQAIDADLCRAIRERAVDGATAADLRQEIDAAAQTIRRHLRGLCDCPHDQPPLAWDAPSQEWVREDLADEGELVTDGGQRLVEACPACDSTEIRVRSLSHKDQYNRVGDERFRCKQCLERFDTPVERPSRANNAGQSRNGLARDLAEADPDEVLPDGGREQIPVCPECGATKIYQRQSRYHSRLDESTPPWHCSACGHDADAPDWRAPKRDSGLSGLAHRLDQADPDDLRADGGQYPCALCNATHDTLEGALQCCGDRLDETDPDGDLWTCDRCGEFATDQCRDDPGDYCLWCRERVDARRRREADAEREVRSDGGEPIDLRLVEAVEAIADEQRYQSAVLTEIVGQLDEVAAAVDDHHREPSETARRSNRALQTALEDQDHERREADDDVRRKLPDGGATQAALVDGPLPDECTTKMCHGAPEWAVRHGDDVSRQHGDSAWSNGPSDGAVAPYVCADCRRDRYPTVDPDDWVRVAATDGGRSMHPTIVPCGNCREPTPVGELVDGPDGRAVCPPCGRGEGHREDVRTDGGYADPDGGAFDHPVRVGAIVRRLHESERTEVLLEVLGRFKHLDDGHIEYRLTCPTRTGYYRYRDEDLDDCFVDTGLTNDESRKAIGDSEIRALYQHLHDEHDEHSFTEVVDPDSGETWQQCLHCGQDESDSLVTDGGYQLDQHIGSMLESWTTRDVPACQCRFCNEQLFEPVDEPAEQFCDCECADAFETVMDARIALGRRDLDQRGFD